MLQPITMQSSDHVIPWALSEPLQWVQPPQIIAVKENQGFMLELAHLCITITSNQLVLCCTERQRFVPISKKSFGKHITNAVIRIIFEVNMPTLPVLLCTDTMRLCKDVTQTYMSHTLYLKKCIQVLAVTLFLSAIYSSLALENYLFLLSIFP